MKFSLLTYNLLFNRALRRVDETLKKVKPDIVCFQEVNTSEQNIKGLEAFGYKLADFSNSLIRFGRVFGNVTFYNPQVFKFLGSQTFDLPSSFVEAMLFLLRKGEIPRTVLKTDFAFKKTGKRITVYNIHLSALAMNTTRKRQITNTFQELSLGKKSPLIIAGDFNFPYKRRVFEALIDKYKLKEATNQIYYTSKLLKILPVKLKLDYILYKNLLLVETERINIKFSDHYPLLSVFNIKSRNNGSS